jgi:hypothetical protein
MAANQPASSPRAARRPAGLRAVRHAARALKRVHDEQVLMWEAAWRSNRFTADHADGTGKAA